MDTTIQQQLAALAEPEYQKFSSRLLPGISNILGVRLPMLRRLAKQISHEDWRVYLAQAQDTSFEEVMLQGLVIGCAPMELSEAFEWISWFLPKINNWSVCDSFCNSLKIAQRYPEDFWQFLLPCLRSQQEYIVRFGAVMLLEYYIHPQRIEQVLYQLEQAKHPGYYARKAVAWAVSICYIRLPKETMPFLLENQLDDFTYRKALQKIIESQKIDPAAKVKIQALRRQK